MEQKAMLTSLNELRNGVEADNVAFKKRMFGGFNKKEVTAYVKTLKESLHNAERSFSSKIEEYSSISAMHKQELDKSLKALREAEVKLAQYEQKITELNDENVSMKSKLEEMSDKSLTQDEIEIYENMIRQNDELKKRVKELEEIQMENKDLKLSNNQMQDAIIEMNSRIESRLSGNVKDEYETAVSENEYLKKYYDEAMSVNSMLIAEKNILSEQNKRISESLTQANEKNKELRDIITRIKLKIRKTMAETQARVYEGSQKHQMNIEQITDNIKNALNIIQYENVDIYKLLDISNEELDIDLEMINSDKKELNSADSY